jgi:hypothetical protein
MTRDVADWAHPEAAQKQQKAAQKLLSQRDVTVWLMDDPRGRHFVWTLLRACKVIDGSLMNHTATAQAAAVALRDFGVEHFLQPVLAHCPQALLTMKEEADNG